LPSRLIVWPSRLRYRYREERAATGYTVRSLCAGERGLELGILPSLRVPPKIGQRGSDPVSLICPSDSKNPRRLPVSRGPLRLRQRSSERELPFAPVVRMTG